MRSPKMVQSAHDEFAADVLGAMVDRHRAKVLAGLDSERAIVLLQLMAPDVAADMLETLEQDTIYQKLPAWRSVPPLMK